MQVVRMVGNNDHEGRIEWDYCVYASNAAGIGLVGSDDMQQYGRRGEQGSGNAAEGEDEIRV